MDNSDKSKDFQLSSGSILGKYKIIAPYRRGAMKEVYRAEIIPELGDSNEECLLTVVLKLFRQQGDLTSESSSESTRRNMHIMREYIARDSAISSSPVDGDPRVKKFFKEVANFKALQRNSGHKNIAKLIDVGMDMDANNPEAAKLYFVEEFVEGKTLSELMSDAPPNADGLKQMNLEQTLSIFSQVADGIKYLHDNDMAHRDLQGHNIIVRPGGQAVITDFGNARLVSTEEYLQYGTILYRSPEELIGESGSKASDMWAMGVLMYQAITGKYPFETDPADWSCLTTEQRTNVIEQLKRKIAFDKVPFLIQYVPNAPRKLSVLVNRAMSRHPEQRIGINKFYEKLQEELELIEKKYARLEVRERA